MIEKTEWEIVDAPASEKRHSARHTMEAMLGRKWKWKLTGATVLGLMTLAFIATLAGLMVLAVALGTLVSFGVRKVTRWLRRDDRPTGVMKL
jgi:hypothetical protein